LLQKTSLQLIIYIILLEAICRISAEVCNNRFTENKSWSAAKCPLYS